MREERKNIDRLFQEKFRDFEASPAEDIWKNIQKELEEEKDSKRILFPLWAKIGSVAAVILALFLIGSLFLNTDHSSVVDKEILIPPLQENLNRDFQNQEIPVNSVLNSAEKIDASVDITSSEDKLNQQLIEEKTIPKKTSNNPVQKDFVKVEDEFKEEDIKKQEIALSTQNVELPQESSDLAEEKTEGKSLFDEIARMEKDQEEEKTKTSGQRFSVRPNLAPVYYNSMKGGSGVDASMAGNKSEGEVTMSYGIDVSYAVAEKVKIRTGVSRVNMSYNTKDIGFIASPTGRGLKALQANAKASNIVVVNKNEMHQRPGEISESSAAPYFPGKLNQQLEYIEVPLEIEFALVEKRLGVNVIGGASTLFLKDDRVQINSEMGATDLGRAANLNSVSFTTNIGVGVGYQLTEKFNVNIEPMFKYQLNGFSGDTGGFKPYYFGIYSGISLKL